MRDPIKIQQILLILLLFALLLYLDQKEVYKRAQQLESGVFITKSPEDKKRLPIRLKIPAISVDAVVEHVGVTTDGAMDVPSNTINTGWFKIGPRPGSQGSSVIAGHFNGERGETGVFANLHKLVVGDTFSVEDATGAITIFKVQKKSYFDPGYAEDVFNRSEGAHLNLITCDGVWDEVKKSYSKRLVVFADVVK